MKISENIKGAILISTSMGAYVANDALMKLSAETVTLPQAIFVRGIIATTLIFFVSTIQSKMDFQKVWKERKFLGLRLLGEIGSTFCFLYAVFNMPLANATAILQSLPLAITLCAIIFFGESVGYKRWLAIIFGFVGVLIIIRPGSEGFNEFSLYALLAVGFIVLRDLVTRKISTEISSTFVTLLSAAVITIFGALLTPITGWNPIPQESLFFLGCASLLLALGSFLNIMTMRVGDISFTAPFRYTLLLWAILFGGLFFNEYPDLTTISGSLIVVLTGIYMIRRQNTSLSSDRKIKSSKIIK